MSNTPTESSGQASLAQYLRFLWRRKLALGLPVAVAVVVAVGLAQRQEPLYRSSTDLLFSSGPSASSGTARERSLPTEARVAVSPAVLAEAARMLDGGTGASLGGAVEAKPLEGVAVLRISARHRSPGRAQAIAAAVASSYIALGRQQAEDQLAKEVAAAQASLADIRGQLDRTLADITAAQVAGRADEVAALGSRRDLLVGEQAVQQGLVQELRLGAAGGSQSASLLVPAEVPDAPVSPRPVRTGVVAGLVGLLVGFAVALSVEHLVTHVRRASQIASALELPILAVVPKMSGRKRKMTRNQILPGSAHQGAEAYGILRSNLAVAGVGEEVRVIMVTSSVAGEGKSTVAANLAAAFADAGVNTVLVDADLRRPKVHQFFSLPNEEGLTSVLDQRIDPRALARAVHEAAGVGSLACLTAGPSTANPTRLLAGPGLGVAIQALRKCALVIIDTPPTLPVADVGIIAAHADALVLVVRPDKVTPSVLEELRSRLGQLGTKAIGVVVNAPDPSTFETSTGYGYGYGYEPLRQERERSRFFRASRNVG